MANLDPIDDFLENTYYTPAKTIYGASEPNGGTPDEGSRDALLSDWLCTENKPRPTRLTHMSGVKRPQRKTDQGLGINSRARLNKR